MKTKILKSAVVVFIEIDTVPKKKHISTSLVIVIYAGFLQLEASLAKASDIIIIEQLETLFYTLFPCLIHPLSQFISLSKR
jgi:hypothetical protein